LEIVVKRIYLVGIALLIPWSSSAQNKISLKPIDCTLLGSRSHECDPSTFGKAIRSAKTVAVIAFESTPSWARVAQRFDPKISVGVRAGLAVPVVASVLGNVSACLGLQPCRVLQPFHGFATSVAEIGGFYLPFYE
jgi:hypothetical protein